MPIRFPTNLLAAALCLFCGGTFAGTPLFSSAPSLISQTTCYTEQGMALPVAVPKRPGNPDDTAALEKYEEYLRYLERVPGFRERLDCFEFTYKVDGLTIRGYVVKPKQSAGRKLPVLIYNRGGNSKLGQLSFLTLAYNHMPWAEQGYIAISTQYRGVGLDEFGGLDVDDVMALLPIIDGMPEADPGRIGMIGSSRGGMMTYLAAARSDRIKAIAILGGVSDLQAEVMRRPEMARVYAAHIPGYLTNREQVLKARSVLYWTDRLNPTLPILLLHGEADVQVASWNAVQMAEKLRERKQPHKLVIYPGGDHGMTRYRKNVQSELMDWFQQHL